MIKVVLDCFGGDRSPVVNIEGAIRALNEIKDLYIIMTGKEDEIKALLEGKEYDKERIEIRHADHVITCHDVPTEAMRGEKISSMSLAYDILRFEDDVKALISLGSTGALLVGAVLKLGRIKGVKRPAFCPILPTMNGNVVGVCDSGANMDCTVENLTQFAIMGNEYMKAMGVESPRIALLNVGVEEGKGDQKRKEVYEILKNMEGLNFVGNMESRDLLSGDYDLIVCDGFDGNVLVKSTEGTAQELLILLKKTFMKNIKTKIGAAFLKKEIYGIKDFMDYNNYGGGVMLGTKKVIIKGHGSSKATAVYNCLKQAYNVVNNKLTEKITELMSE